MIFSYEADLDCIRIGLDWCADQNELKTLTPLSSLNEIRVAPNLQCASVNCSELDQGLQFCQQCSKKIEHLGGLRSAECASVLVPNLEAGSVEERWSAHLNCGGAHWCTIEMGRCTIALWWSTFEQGWCTFELWCCT